MTALDNLPDFDIRFILQPDRDMHQIRNAKMIYYAARTTWWTHDLADLHFIDHHRHGALHLTDKVIRRVPAGHSALKYLPSDPRGSVLFQTENVLGFMQNAVDKSFAYGKHGIVAFWAAHAKNVFKRGTNEMWSAKMWDDVSVVLDMMGLEPVGKVS